MPQDHRKPATEWPLAQGKAVWMGRALSAAAPLQLDDVQARELSRLARREDIRVEDIARETLRSALPTLAPLMARVAAELATGRGICVVRGLPVEELTDAQCARAFWALGAFIGQGVAQSSAGDLIGFVRDRGEGRQENRGYQSRAALGFHVDLSDVAGLLCVRRAKQGGESLAASSLAIYNEMRASHPEYLQALAPGFHWSRNGEEGPGEAPYSPVLPVFTVVDGVVSCRYNASMMRRGTQQAGLALTPLQDRALSFIEETARRPEFHHAQYMEPGDAQFFNNFTVLHSRTAFENDAAPGKDRLVLRLWLRVDGLRPFGTCEALMRDAPLVYGLQGRDPIALKGGSR
ncbi:MAG: TauD/TfdA family dioxygenase [Burkholderiaceae bacterium]|nr:TauD/TfdA family dioxygenase [Burkholderiaceae bacterium]